MRRSRAGEIQQRLGNSATRGLLLAQFFPQGNQRAPTPPVAQRLRGTPTQAMFFIWNPRLETDAGLRAALGALGRYSAHVPVTRVEIRLLPESERHTVLGSDLRFGGDSFWEDGVPVVRLPQETLDVIARHLAGTAEIHDVHEVIRTVGHEMHHLWRTKEGNRANPLQPLYEAESEHRLNEVRANWVRSIRSGTTRIEGVPQTITQWSDIPEAERERIERGASRTEFIQGLYERSAYIVEEIYTKIEELAFLRIQQQNEAAGARRSPSRTAVSELAQQIYRLKNQMDSMVGEDRFVTPELWQRTQQAMLEYLRARYPNQRSPGLDSFEVLFFLTAMRSGRPPLIANGRLQSVPPPGARVERHTSAGD